MKEYKERYYHTRNYGCRIKEYILNGLKTISMENEVIKISLLPDKGTDIFEFVYKPKDIDVMWHSFNGIKDPANVIPTIQHPGGPFLDSYEGGWQEIFPNIGDPCDYKQAPLGIHGEVALIPWEYEIIENTPYIVSIKFRVRTIRTPFLLEKVLTIKSNDPKLYIDEVIENLGYEDMHYTWGHHPAFGPAFLDESCKIYMPEDCKAKASRIGNWELSNDIDFKWPIATGKDGYSIDLSIVPSNDKNLYHTFYLYDIPEGWFKITNMNYNISFKMEWDHDVFPYIWVWAPYGGAYGYPWYARNYNLAIEPWSSMPDNLENAIMQGSAKLIKAKDIFQTKLTASVYDSKV